MIPKIIHQIWIGKVHSPPMHLLHTWRDKHPDFEYILWTDEEIERRNFEIPCYKQYRLCPELCGKADILRIAILKEYGGIYIDADSMCIEPIDDYLLKDTTIFACFENETVRKGLIANGVIGTIPNHPLMCDMLQYIDSGECDHRIQTTRAWYAVGPVLFTSFINTGRYPEIRIFPSHVFYPHHFTGEKYDGHKKVYGFQFWSSVNQYASLHEIPCLPKDILPPSNGISVEINIDPTTEKSMVYAFMESLRRQKGHYMLEIVTNHTFEDEWNQLLKTSRFISIATIHTENFSLFPPIVICSTNNTQKKYYLPNDYFIKGTKVPFKTLL